MQVAGSTVENGIKGNVENGRILLELPTNDKLNSNQNYKEAIPDYSFAPESRFFADFEKEKIQKMVETLPEMERKVVEYRYNFQNDEKVKTLRQVGEELGVSAETVRQMEMRAIKQLRAVITSA